jgi:hypothetical protein
MTFDFFKELFDYPVRRMGDRDLETFISYVAREMVEAKINNNSEAKADFEAWYKVLTNERKRRIELAKHGAPKYKGEEYNIAHLINGIKQYYVGDRFAQLFEQITGFQVFHGIDKLRYRCTLHGADKHPSGVLYLNEGRYHCFGCGTGGDVFQLVMTFKPYLSFTEVVDELVSQIPHYTKTEEGRWKRV